MSQLVVSIDSRTGLHRADDLRWCWLSEGQVQSSSSGSLESLRASLDNLTHQAWLLLPGSSVVTRELEYTEKEKKHLRNLLPFQLEESVIGDIDELHVAMGTPQNGKVALAYTDKQWLKTIFKQLADIGVEITRCWSAPSLLPLSSPAPEALEPVLTEAESTSESLALSPSAIWVLALENGQVNVRFAEQEGFSVPLSLLAPSLNMLVESKGLKDNLPMLSLRAAQESELNALYKNLPTNLSGRVQTQTLVDPWLLDFNGNAIDLCQAEFSQRLPLERWMKLWRGVGVLALVTFVAYVGVLGFQIAKLNKQNMQLRQQMEAVYRSVIPNGQADDPEKRLRVKVQAMQPKTQSGSVMATLAGVLPLISNNPDVTVKVISYSADTGDMSISVQAHSFNTIDALRQSISAQGYTAELQGVNAQGDLNTGRLKISKQQR
ncbi:type II secretion system protein GspL [Cellvibrio sp.]|uniref:type II secretion system protein GspL n=1 Tax=Cellvibrio sp. TaxID=1965322 RepID=UPI003964843C